MVELENPGRRATSAVLADEPAPGVLVLPHRTPDVRRDRPRSRRLARPARPVGRSELLLLELDDQDVERAVEHCGNVATLGEQVLRSAQLVVGRALDRDLEVESLIGDRGDPRAQLGLRRRRRGDHGWWNVVDLRRRKSGQRRDPLVQSQDLDLRKSPRKQQLDLALAQACRRSQQLVDVVGRQVRNEQIEAGQVHTPVSQSGAELRKLAHLLRHLETLPRCVIRQSELLDAVGVHRRVARGRVQAAGVDFGHVRQEIRGGRSVLRDEGGQAAEQEVVADIRQPVRAHGRTLSRGREAIRRGLECMIVRSAQLCKTMMQQTSNGSSGRRQAASSDQSAAT